MTDEIRINSLTPSSFDDYEAVEPTIHHLDIEEMRRQLAEIEGVSRNQEQYMTDMQELITETESRTAELQAKIERRRNSRLFSGIKFEGSIANRISQFVKGIFTYLKQGFTSEDENRARTFYFMSAAGISAFSIVILVASL